MALVTNYATLVTAIEDYLDRSELTTWVPNWLQNFQARLYREVRIRDMETALSDTISSGVIGLPTGYLDLKYAYVDRAPVTFLQRMSPEQLYTKYPTRSGAAVPCVISREGTNFIFGPYPGDYDIAGIYYKRYTILNGSDPTTNWFTTNAPDILMYGSLLEAAPFLHDDPRLITWKALYDEAYKSIEDEERMERRSGSAPQVRIT